MSRQRVYQSRSQSQSSGLEVSGILQRRGVVRTASEPKGNREEETKNHSAQESSLVKDYQPVPVRSQFEKDHKPSVVEESGWKRSFVSVPVHGNRLSVVQRSPFLPQQLPQHPASVLYRKMDRQGGILATRIPERFPVQPIQAKLTIGQPNDKYEQEADRLASQVIQHINASASTKSTEAQEEKEIQAKPEITSLQSQEAIAKGESSTGLASAINIARRNGQPLDAGLQQSMGQTMGVDFSGVRVHTDAQSDRLNQSIQAKAFTTGQDIFFRQGAYDPGSRGGQELIAHELTHVVQQTEGTQQQFFLNSEIHLQRSPVSVVAKQGAKAVAKKAIKEFIENQIKSRLKQYMSKQFAKQFVKDADDILNILDSSWWEIGIELIPIVGDIYGAGSFAKKLDHLWDRVKILEKKVQLVTTAASKTLKKITLSSKLTGKGKEKLEILVNKVNNISEHFTEDDLAGAAKDILGDPVIIGGKKYDHLKEVNEALKGLGNQLDKLKSGINKAEFEGDTLEEASRLLSTLSKQKDEIQNVLVKVKSGI